MARDQHCRLGVRDLPLSREPGKARTIEQIRGMACRQLRKIKRLPAPPKNDPFIPRKVYVRYQNNLLARKKVMASAFERRRALKKRIEKEIDTAAKELRVLDQEIVKREEILALKEKAPTVKEMRAATAALFKDNDLSPIKELIKMVKRNGRGALNAKDKAQIYKYLAEYEAPKPKSVDIQADIDSSVTVSLLDFRNTGQEQIKQAAPAASDEEYDEFELKEE